MMRQVTVSLLPLALAAFVPQADKDRPLANIATSIARQLVDKECWTDHRDMPNARNLTTTLRIYLGADGHLTKEPELIHPPTLPASDIPLRTFIGFAQDALAKCNAMRFDIPAGSSELLATNYIDIMFTPRIEVSP